MSNPVRIDKTKILGMRSGSNMKVSTGKPAGAVKPGGGRPIA